MNSIRWCTRAAEATLLAAVFMGCGSSNGSSTGLGAGGSSGASAGATGASGTASGGAASGATSTSGGAGVNGSGGSSGTASTNGGATNGGASLGSGGANTSGATGGAGLAGAPASGGAQSGGGAGRGGSAGATSGGGRPAGGASSGGSSGAIGTGGKASGGAGGNAGTTPVTVWIAGDSTVQNCTTACPCGWGSQFMPYFNSNVKVNNSAVGGRSIQTWLYEANVSSTLGADGECTLTSTAYDARWTAMLNATTGMKPGDYLFVQFGINDTDATCPRHVGLARFQSLLGVMAQAAMMRGAQPIFVTAVSSIGCNGSTAIPTRGAYATAAQTAGMTYGVPVIDLQHLSVNLYNKLGFCPIPGGDTMTSFETGAIGAFFCEDHTHFEAAGAVQIAGLVAQALRDQNFGLAAYLK